MSDDDEFFESSSNEEGDEGSGEEGEGQESDGSDSGSADESGTGEGSEEGDSTGETGDSGDEGDAGEGASDDDEAGEEGDGSAKEGDGKGEGEEGSGDDSGSESGDEGDEGKGETEFFDFEEESDEGDGKPAVSFKDLGKTLDIELENDTKEEFAEKVNEKIEAAKQQVDLSKFDPEARRLVKHLNENDGKIGDFFVNPKITSYQGVLNLGAEEKVSMIRRQELIRSGSTAEEADQEIKEELSNMSAKQIMDTAAKIDNDAKKLIDQEIEEIVGEHESRVEENRQQEEQKAEKQRESLKNYVQKQDNFLGLKLSDKARQVISRDIDSGRFDQIADLSDDEVRFAAYMIKRQGGKITERFVKQLAEGSRDGYNKGLDKMTGKLHKSKKDAQGASSGHQESSGGKKNFENWGELEF